MKALVWTAPGRMEIQEREAPRPQPGQVLIRSVAVGLCGSDVHVFEGQFAPAVPPLVLGHESAGVVAEIGEGPVSLRSGDRVVVNPNVNCGCCHFCRRGLPHQCLHRRIIGLSGWDGGLADFFLAPVENVHRLPDSVTWLDGASMDSLASPIHGLNLVPARVGETVAVFGAGTSGLCFIQLCRLRGASRIVAVDVKQERLERAAELGAHYVVNAARQKVPEEIREVTEGLGVDLAIEASGATAAVPLCIKSTRNCGRVLIYGVYGGLVGGVDFQDQHRREITIYGCTGAPDTYATAVGLVSEGRIRLEFMVTHQLRLAEAPGFFSEGIIRDCKDNYLKGVVRMDQE